MQIRTYTHNGQQMTITQLAEIAGCSRNCMAYRLESMDVADAIAKGQPPGRKLPLTTILHEYRGQMLSCAQLAKIAGCKIDAMRWRISRMGVERAVALGASGLAGGEYELNGELVSLRELANRAGCARATLLARLKRTGSIAEAMVKPAAKPAKVTQTKPAGSATLNKASWAERERKARDKADRSKPQGEPIITAKTVITKAPPHQERFHVEPGSYVPLFGAMGFGRYLDSDSAIARQYG